MSENNDTLEHELYERIFVRLSDIKSIDQDVVRKWLICLNDINTKIIVKTPRPTFQYHKINCFGGRRMILHELILSNWQPFYGSGLNGQIKISMLGKNNEHNVLIYGQNTHGKSSYLAGNSVCNVWQS